MDRAFLFAILLLALLIGGFSYFGLSKFLLIAVVFGLWLILSVILSFVSDGRYTRAFGDAKADRLSTGSSAERLSIGRALLVGELVINVPAIGLLVGVIAVVGSLLQSAVGYDGVGNAPALAVTLAVILAFVVSWLWWATATPRWLLWAMKRVSDPMALKRAAVGSILWQDQKWGAFFNRTQWRSGAMEKEERDLIRRAAARVNESRAAARPRE